MASGVHTLQKISLFFLVLGLTLVVFTGCTSGGEANSVQSSGPQVKQENQQQAVEQTGSTVAQDGEDSSSRNIQLLYYSPFTGIPRRNKMIEKAVMASIENAPQARPQSGLEQASLVYEFLVEGGITRFLALYWGDIPDKIGPIRSLRPYLIKTGQEYDALLLHAGASPDGFAMLGQSGIEHLDQIYNGKYYWRNNDRRPPHNLYTGDIKLQPYLRELTDQEYDPRFHFQQISLINPGDIKAERIKIDYWGQYNVLYRYSPADNLYYRYLYDWDHPHLSDTGDQLTARNIIIQHVQTEVIDSEGRLSMQLTGRGKSLVFKDGIVVPGYWENQGEGWTRYYDQQGHEISVNPGQTWIQVVPESAKITYSTAADKEE